jgi:hypothetical protein
VTTHWKHGNHNNRETGNGGLARHWDRELTVEEAIRRAPGRPGAEGRGVTRG